jgi:hypothetical protein
MASVNQDCRIYTHRNFRINVTTHCYETRLERYALQTQPTLWLRAQSPTLVTIKPATEHDYEPVPSTFQAHSLKWTLSQEVIPPKFCSHTLSSEPGYLSCIALGYGLVDRGFEPWQELGIFLFTTASRPALDPTQLPFQWVPGALFPGVVKRPGHEADHSPPSSAEVKEWVELYLHSPSTPWCCGAQLKHRDNFTFAFIPRLPHLVTDLHYPISTTWRVWITEVLVV